MKSLLLLLTISISSYSISQTTSIPDASFEQALINLGYDNGVTDGLVVTANINTVSSLTINWQSITDLTGIEDFAALTDLNCMGNSLTSLDLSQNLALINLNCSSNQLSSINLTQNTNLINLDCSGNQLTSLTITNVALTNLLCYFNQLTSLDITQATALKTMNCIYNQLPSLNTSQNVALTKLICSNNQLAALNVTQNLNLDTLECAYNQIPSLDVSQNTALRVFNCHSNQISSIDVTQNVLLWRLNCGGNLLTALDVSQNTALLNLNFNYTSVPSIDVSQNTLLQQFISNSNPVITSIDLTNNPDLNYLSCEDSDLLNCVSIKNGGNIANFTFLYITNCPQLPCIEVDDVAHINTFWWAQILKDASASYNTNCNCLPIALPIELLSFTGYSDAMGNQLVWETQSEYNNDYFTLERSLDGNHFSSIGVIDGKGTSNSIERYQFLDFKPPLGVIYYRLKQSDFDGVSSYSDIITLESGTNPDIFILQSASLLSIQSSNREIVQIKIFDASGKIMCNQIATESVWIDASTWSNGVYFIHAETTHDAIIKKILIRNQ